MPAGLCLSKTSTQTAGPELTLVTLLYFNIERALEQILPGKQRTETKSGKAALGCRAAELRCLVKSV